MKKEIVYCQVEHHRRMKTLEMQSENYEAQEIFFFTGLAVLYFIFQVCVGPLF